MSLDDLTPAQRAFAEKIWAEQRRDNEEPMPMDLDTVFLPDLVLRSPGCLSETELSAGIGLAAVREWLSTAQPAGLVTRANDGNVCITERGRERFREIEAASTVRF